MRRNIRTGSATAFLIISMLAPTAPAASSVRAVTPNAKTNAAIVAPPAAQASSVGVNGYFSVDPAQQGSTFQAAIVFDIPEGMHVNSNRPQAQ